MNTKKTLLSALLGLTLATMLPACSSTCSPSPDGSSCSGDSKCKEACAEGTCGKCDQCKKKAEGESCQQ